MWKGTHAEYRLRIQSRYTELGVGNNSQRRPISIYRHAVALPLLLLITQSVYSVISVHCFTSSVHILLRLARALWPSVTALLPIKPISRTSQQIRVIIQRRNRCSFFRSRDEADVKVVSQFRHLFWLTDNRHMIMSAAAAALW